MRKRTWWLFVCALTALAVCLMPRNVLAAGAGLCSQQATTKVAPPAYIAMPEASLDIDDDGCFGTGADPLLDQGQRAPNFGDAFVDGLTAADSATTLPRRACGLVDWPMSNLSAHGMSCFSRLERPPR